MDEYHIIILLTAIIGIIPALLASYHNKNRAEDSEINEAKATNIAGKVGAHVVEIISAAKDTNVNEKEFQKIVDEKTVLITDELKRL